MKKVSKEEFYKFVNSYPRKLEYDVTGYFDPPLATFNDFTLGDWPDSIVASYSKNDWMENKGDHDYRILVKNKRKLEFMGIVPSFTEEGFNRIELQKIPSVGDTINLPKIFNVTEGEPPRDYTLLNFAKDAFFGNKCLKVTIEYED